MKIYEQPATFSSTNSFGQYVTSFDTRKVYECTFDELAQLLIDGVDGCPILIPINDRTKSLINAEDWLFEGEKYFTASSRDHYDIGYNRLHSVWKEVTSE